MIRKALLLLACLLIPKIALADRLDISACEYFLNPQSGVVPRLEDASDIAEMRMILDQAEDVISGFEESPDALGIEQVLTDMIGHFNRRLFWQTGFLKHRADAAVIQERIAQRGLGVVDAGPEAKAAAAWYEENILRMSQRMEALKARAVSLLEAATVRESNESSGVTLH